MKNLGRLSFAAAVAFAASYACAAPKMYVAGSPGEPCKASYDGFVVEYAKAASNGDISVKFKGAPAMGPIPKKFAAPYASFKAGDKVCIPGSAD